MRTALAGTVGSKRGVRLIGASLRLLIGHGGSFLWPLCRESSRLRTCRPRDLSLVQQFVAVEAFCQALQVTYRSPDGFKVRAPVLTAPMTLTTCAAAWAG